ATALQPRDDLVDPGDQFLLVPRLIFEYVHNCVANLVQYRKHLRPRDNLGSRRRRAVLRLVIGVRLLLFPRRWLGLWFFGRLGLDLESLQRLHDTATGLLHLLVSHQRLTASWRNPLGELSLRGFVVALHGFADRLHLLVLFVREGRSLGSLAGEV